MARRKTWKILSGEKHEWDGKELPFQCVHCEWEAGLPTHGPAGDAILCVFGMSIIWDHPGHEPPADWLPREIECRRCHNVYTTDPLPEEVSDHVR